MEKELEYFEGMPIIEASGIKAYYEALEKYGIDRNEKHVVKLLPSKGTVLNKIPVLGDIVSILIIDDSKKEIGNKAFENCSNLTRIILPNTITKIGEKAFNGCRNLHSITIPGSVKIIARNAFDGCYFLTVSRNNELLSAPETKSFAGAEFIDEVSEDGLCIKDHVILRAPQNITSAKIPTTVTTIGCSAFEGCTKLCSIEIPTSVESIDSHAFEGCTSLESLTLPNITYIPYQMCKRCTSLKSVVIPEGVKEIDFEAFSGCSSLEKVEMPYSLKKISSSAFYSHPSSFEIIRTGEKMKKKFIEKKMSKTTKQTIDNLLEKYSRLAQRELDKGKESIASEIKKFEEEIHVHFPETLKYVLCRINGFGEIYDVESDPDCMDGYSGIFCLGEIEQEYGWTSGCESPFIPLQRDDSFNYYGYDSESGEIRFFDHEYRVVDEDDSKDLDSWIINELESAISRIEEAIEEEDLSSESD